MKDPMKPRRAPVTCPMTTKGKPRVYKAIPDETFDRILERVSAGEGLVKSCKEEKITDVGRFYARLNANENDSHSYAQAKYVALDRLAQEILELQDQEPPLRSPGGEAPGDPRVDTGWVQWRRNQVEARKWLLSKLAPKVYGDKLDATLAAPDGGPVQAEVRVVEGLDVFRERLLKVLANHAPRPETGMTADAGNGGTVHR